jgi:hypothetical protein
MRLVVLGWLTGPGPRVSLGAAVGFCPFRVLVLLIGLGKEITIVAITMSIPMLMSLSLHDLLPQYSIPKPLSQAYWLVAPTPVPPR